MKTLLEAVQHNVQPWGSENSCYVDGDARSLYEVVLLLRLWNIRSKAKLYIKLDREPRSRRQNIVQHFPLGSLVSFGATLSLPTGCWFLFSRWSSLPPGVERIMISGVLGLGTWVDVTFSRHILKS